MTTASSKTVPAASATDLNLVVATLVASRLPMGNDEQSQKNAANIIAWAAELAVEIAGAVDTAVKAAVEADTPPVDPPVARSKS
jgi:hypothetical protein